MMTKISPSLTSKLASLTPIAQPVSAWISVLLLPDLTMASALSGRSPKTLKTFFRLILSRRSSSDTGTEVLASIFFSALRHGKANLHRR